MLCNSNNFKVSLLSFDFCKSPLDFRPRRRLALLVFQTETWTDMCRAIQKRLLGVLTQPFWLAGWDSSGEAQAGEESALLVCSKVRSFSMLEGLLTLTPQLRLPTDSPLPLVREVQATAP